MPFHRAEWSSVSEPVSRSVAVLAVLFVLVSVTTSAQSQELRLQFAPATTTIGFTLGDVLHTVHGSFNLKSGEVRYDAGSAAVQGSLVVDATSGQSANRIRDRRMHREILESERYPEIRFRPDHVEGKVANGGTSTVQVHGIFSIHGADHELTMPIRVQVFADHWVADTNFTVPYVKWGIKNPSSFLLRVSESVEIAVHATGTIPVAPSGGH
jgi:polyisoprenoid-binding protein YceI